MLICVKGKGYTYTWPEALGTTPWEDGKADKVLRQDYEPVGMVSAAPMSGDWFHQHFGVGKEGLRITAWHGPNNQRARKPGRPGEQLMDYGAIDLKKGGSAIPYHEEDGASAGSSNKRSRGKASPAGWRSDSTSRHRTRDRSRRN